MFRVIWVSTGSRGIRESVNDWIDLRNHDSWVSKMTWILRDSGSGLSHDFGKAHTPGTHCINCTHFVQNEPLVIFVDALLKTLQISQETAQFPFSVDLPFCFVFFSKQPRGAGLITGNSFQSNQNLKFCLCVNLMPSTRLSSKTTLP